MNVDVIDESGTGVDVLELTRLCRWVMAQMGLHPATEVSLRLVDQDTITTLNERWMGEEGPTDVLSFPMDELRPTRDGEEQPPGYLGDIALCPQVAARSARSDWTELDEIRMLTVHGLLHLLGYDHAEPDEHREMFGIQDRLMVEWDGARHDGTGTAGGGS